jgi:hypothetical protein
MTDALLNIFFLMYFFSAVFNHKTVNFGGAAEIAPRSLVDVRFTPKSGHSTR